MIKEEGEVGNETEDQQKERREEEMGKQEGSEGKNEEGQHGRISRVRLEGQLEKKDWSREASMSRQVKKRNEFYGNPCKYHDFFFCDAMTSCLLKFCYITLYCVSWR